MTLMATSRASTGSCAAHTTPYEPRPISLRIVKRPIVFGGTSASGLATSGSVAVMGWDIGRDYRTAIGFRSTEMTRDEDLAVTQRRHGACAYRANTMRSSRS